MTQNGSSGPSICTRCCVAGGGPAGMMLGFLLARSGIDTVVLEKHGDFLRDFRGDTIHPSTLEVIHELGLLEDFLRRPHSEVRELRGQVGDTEIPIADFSHLPTRCKFIALMPQWDFLDFLAGAGRRYPQFHLHMSSEATALVEADGRVAGLRAIGAAGEQEIRAELVIAADGRHSTLRAGAGFEVVPLGAPMDVLWMRLSKHPSDANGVLGRFDRGRILVMLDRGDYWQCAFVIRKGAAEEIRRRGLEAFRREIASVQPMLADRVAALEDWDQIKLLTVAVDRLQRWYRPGLLCIGDAAHAMSPVGGIGVNLAIQDAVAAANILVPAFRQGTPSVDRLREVQQRRLLPTRLTQGMQIMVQNRVIGPVLGGAGTPLRLPLPLRLLRRWPILRRLPGRLIGMGFRPEHLRH